MANPSLLDDDYMAAALELAKRGAGWVNPNPMVGCLIVKDGEILGRDITRDSVRPMPSVKRLPIAYVAGGIR